MDPLDLLVVEDLVVGLRASEVWSRMPVIGFESGKMFLVVIMGGCPVMRWVASVWVRAVQEEMAHRWMERCRGPLEKLSHPIPTGEVICETGTEILGKIPQKGGSLFFLERIALLNHVSTYSCVHSSTPSSTNSFTHFLFPCRWIHMFKY